MLEVGLILRKMPKFEISMRYNKNQLKFIKILKINIMEIKNNIVFNVNNVEQYIWATKYSM
jgi:hypothetical protein